MDLTSENFSVHLPWLLNELSTSCFVSFDLELSGIPLGHPGQVPKDMSLAERYMEYKLAAEKYQILQLGLTICLEDPQEGVYVLKPYNINLCPIIKRDLDVSRDWTCMSGAMEFLIGNHFSMDDVCKKGVRYLSRDEESKAMKVASRRYNPKTMVESIDAQTMDRENQDFLIQVRHVIETWMTDREKSPAKKGQDFLNIPGRGKNQPPAFPLQLSATQKWLIRQLVTVYYPRLKTRNKSTFVQVDFKERQDDDDDTKEAARKRIKNHVGCRWIVEALVDGDLSGLGPDDFASLLTKIKQPKFKLETVAARLKTRIKENKVVFVGHNCFLDLVFFYSCFIGPLPDTLDEFQALIHDLFPIVVDTKYLATYQHGQGKKDSPQCLSNSNSSLDDINRNMARIKTPHIYIDASHSKYLFNRYAHEAGYDSMMAAVAFIKLATQLQQGKPLQAWGSPNRGVLDDMNLRSTAGIQEVENLLMNMPERDSDPTFEDFSEDNIVLTDDEPEGVGILAKKSSNPRPALAQTESIDVTAKVKGGFLIPRLGSDFWDKYGNKLRAFGTSESTVFLDGKPAGKQTWTFRKTA